MENQINGKGDWLSLSDLGRILEKDYQTIKKMLQRKKFTLIKQESSGKGGGAVGKRFLVHISDPAISAEARLLWYELKKSGLLTDICDPLFLEEVDEVGESCADNGGNSTLKAEEASVEECNISHVEPLLPMVKEAEKSVEEKAVSADVQSEKERGNLSGIDWQKLVGSFNAGKLTEHKLTCSKCGMEITIGIFCQKCLSESKGRYANWISLKSSVILRERCGVSKRHLSASLKDYPQRTITQNAWNSVTDSFFLTGLRGAGKTHLAVAMMRQEIMSLEPEVVNGELRLPMKKLPLFVFVPELIRELAESRLNYGSKAVIEKYSNVRLLVLDDIIAEGYREWVEDLFLILDRRYREMMRTIITTNISLEEIAEKLNDRIASRIAGMCKVNIVQGQDKRLRSEQN